MLQHKIRHEWHQCSICRGGGGFDPHWLRTNPLLVTKFFVTGSDSNSIKCI